MSHVVSAYWTTERIDGGCMICNTDNPLIVKIGGKNLTSEIRACRLHAEMIRDEIDRMLKLKNGAK